ncbi:TIGR02444 family protein [Vibrio aestuarianus]|uniref:TIGR02444 family protein n=1 Tax=Vibrio aestuarianus TaxID=28171 RepID=UPI00237C69ED|nr:TIGR02444 family protein [Vibrio aestuarianus]MDE1265390.1 TIGR02444 family protein [Vibrio aestuarianus]MDE1297543.1 TIGR02444 family protein [Vibrio aestuarianus]
MSKEHVRISLTLERLWQFSLQYYSVREVKEACLSLQNNYHGNVNLLLLLKWLDEQQVSFAEHHWQTVQDCLSRSETLLHSYRDLRRRLKTNLPDTLYREALQFELQLEKQQQSDLVDCINALSLANNTGQPLTQRYCRLLAAEHLCRAFAEPAPQSGKA